MLTGHYTDSDTILGLEFGANDYVTKPFRFAVRAAVHSITGGHRLPLEAA